MQVRFQALTEPKILELLLLHFVHIKKLAS